ncbi:MAG: hypothetical protein H0W67_04540 [Gemmatimonadales bacterium]|nr:hypothetical protein [Gemmatimonadales bacterium]
MNAARREARLRPEFAHLYPPLQAGSWQSAGRMADWVVSWRLREARGYMAPDRVLHSEHFEFRGGAPGSGPSAMGRRSGE